jgi:hypothetical protein
MNLELALTGDCWYFLSRPTGGKVMLRRIFHWLFYTKKAPETLLSRPGLVSVELL